MLTDEEKELLQQQKEDDEDIKSQEKFEAKQRKEMLSGEYFIQINLNSCVFRVK